MISDTNGRKSCSSTKLINQYTIHQFFQAPCLFFFSLKSINLSSDPSFRLEKDKMRAKKGKEQNIYSHMLDNRPISSHTFFPCRLNTHQNSRNCCFQFLSCLLLLPLAPSFVITKTFRCNCLQNNYTPFKTGLFLAR